MSKAKGVIWYYLDKGHQPDGTRPLVPLGKDYLEALRRYAELVKTVEAPTVTLPEMLVRWQGETLIGRPPRTQEDIVASVKRLVVFFSDPSPAPLDQVEPIHITQYLRWRSAPRDGKKGAPVRANREVAWLSAGWNWARSTGLTKAQNPCDGVKRNKETGRDIYIEDDELGLIVAQADEPLREAIELAYLIGQRPGDLRRISEADIRGGVLHLRQSKTTAAMAIAVTGQLEVLIDRIRARKASIEGVRCLSLLVDERGQPMGRSMMIFRFAKAREAAAVAAESEEAALRLRQIQFRDLRAKAGTDVRDMANLDAAQGLLGHSQSGMTEHYTRRRRGKTVNPVR
jgi:integrase